MGSYRWFRDKWINQVQWPVGLASSSQAMQLGFVSLKGGLIIEYFLGNIVILFVIFSPLFIYFKSFINGLIVLSFPFVAIQLQLEKRKAKMKENHSFFRWEKDSLSEGWVENYCSCCKIRLLAYSLSPVYNTWMRRGGGGNFLFYNVVMRMVCCLLLEEPVLLADMLGNLLSSMSE